jgi:hypothetical protein
MPVRTRLLALGLDGFAQEGRHVVGKAGRRPLGVSTAPVWAAVTASTIGLLAAPFWAFWPFSTLLWPFTALSSWSAFLRGDTVLSRAWSCRAGVAPGIRPLTQFAW